MMHPIILDAVVDASCDSTRWQPEATNGVHANMAAGYFGSSELTVAKLKVVLSTLPNVVETFGECVLGEEKQARPTPPGQLMHVSSGDFTISDRNFTLSWPSGNLSDLSLAILRSLCPFCTAVACFQLDFDLRPDVLLATSAGLAITASVKTSVAEVNSCEFWSRSLKAVLDEDVFSFWRTPRSFSAPLDAFKLKAGEKDRLPKSALSF